MIGKLNKTEEEAVRNFSRELKEFSGKNIKQILLFGSKARGGFSKDSDLDLFVLAEQVDARLRRKSAQIVNQILLKYGILISPRLIPEIRYAYQKHLETGFIKNVERDGVIIE